MSAPLSIGARGLRKAFKRGAFELDVPSLHVEAGATLALLGPSGSGKSTLLHLLGLLSRPDAGQVEYEGVPVTPRDREARLAAAAVFQRPYLFKGSVGANVAYGLAARGVHRSQQQDRVCAALARVGLEGYEQRSALTLSGGEAQRVSLARALVLEPRVLLLDEPMASLDPLLKRRLTRDFSTILRQSGVTVLYVTHDQDEALVVADRIAVMNAGRIIVEGAAEEVAGLVEDEWAANFLGIEPAIQGTVTAVSEGLAEVSATGVRVFVAGEPPLGARVFVAVRPEDVLLFQGEVDLPLTTARNRLAGTVVSVEPEGATLRVTLGINGVRIASSISRASAAELGIHEGSRVLAVFKATSVRWRYAEEASVDSSQGGRG